MSQAAWSARLSSDNSRPLALTLTSRLGCWGLCRLHGSVSISCLLLCRPSPADLLPSDNADDLAGGSPQQILQAAEVNLITSRAVPSLLTDSFSSSDRDRAFSRPDLRPNRRSRPSSLHREKLVGRRQGSNERPACSVGGRCPFNLARRGHRGHARHGGAYTSTLWDHLVSSLTLTVSRLRPTCTPTTRRRPSQGSQRLYESHCPRRRAERGGRGILFRPFRWMYRA